MRRRCTKECLIWKRRENRIHIHAIIHINHTLFPFDCLIRLNKGKNNQGKTLNCFPNILLAANKILSSNFIKRAISCSPVSFLEQKCEANFMIVLFAVHFLKGSDPIGFLLFSPPPPGSPGLDFFIRHMLLAHCLAVLESSGGTKT